MNKGQWKKIVSILFVSILILSSVSGCSEEKKDIPPMEPEESLAVSLDFIGGKDVMPVAGYYGPYASFVTENGVTLPNLISEENFKAFAEAGVNLISYSITDYAKYPNVVKTMLEYGEKYGIAVVVKDEKILTLGEQEDVSLEDVSLRLLEYMNYPAFSGMYICDEPYTSSFMTENLPERDINRYKTIAPILNQKFDFLNYTNALGGSELVTARGDYKPYLEEFCEKLQPDYLLYDRYPFFVKHEVGGEGNTDIRTMEEKIYQYFNNLAVVREVAYDNGIPFWVFIQAGNHYSDAGEAMDTEFAGPNEGEFNWNVNTCLSFGAQGLNYFTLMQPYHFANAATERFDFERNGMIGLAGNKNRWYYYAQNLSTHLSAIDSVLMNSVSKGVLASGDEVVEYTKYAQYAMLEGTSWRELKDVKGDALVGCFNYQGKTALYVTNYYYDYAQLVDLTFEDSYNVTMIQDGETSKIKGDSVTLDMKAGEGVLLVFE